jgi:hypothetical protein
VVDWSPVNINNFSIANRDSHELVSVPDNRVSVEWVLFFFSLIQPSIRAISYIGKLIIFNFSKVIKFIEGLLSDWNDLFYNIPKDPLGAWNSGQRALVSPSSVELQELDKLR